MIFLQHATEEILLKIPEESKYVHRLRVLCFRSETRELSNEVYIIHLHLLTHLSIDLTISQMPVFTMEHACVLYSFQQSNVEASVVSGRQTISFALMPRIKVKSRNDKSMFLLNGIQFPGRHSQGYAYATFLRDQEGNSSLKWGFCNVSCMSYFQEHDLEKSVKTVIILNRDVIQATRHYF